MAIKRVTQIEVQIAWKKKRRRGNLTYAYLRWRQPPKDPRGKSERKEESLGYVTEAEAEEARARKEASLRLGLEQPSSDGYTVVDLLADYVTAVEESPTTTEHKDRVAGDADGLMRHLGRLQADALTAHHVRHYLAMRSREKVLRVRRRKGESDDAWMERCAAARMDPDGKPVASTTIRNEIGTLRRAMRWGKDAALIKADPVPMPHRKSLRKDQRPPRRLTEGEVRRLVDAAPPEYSELVVVLAWSGRRPVAIFDLRLEDLDRLFLPGLAREERLVFWRADKGGEATGWGPVTEPTFQALRRRALALQEQGAPRTARLWTTATGKPLASTSWPKTFAKIATAAGVENVVSYDLRKHACAQLLRQIGNAAEAIKYSGHKTVEMFLRVYAYALEGGAEARAEHIGWTPQALRLVKGEPDGT